MMVFEEQLDHLFHAINNGQMDYDDAHLVFIIANKRQGSNIHYEKLSDLSSGGAESIIDQIEKKHNVKYFDTPRGSKGGIIPRFMKV